MTISALPASFAPPVLPEHARIEEGPWWVAWNFDPHFLLPLAIVTFFYLRGLRRWEERSRQHSGWRTASFLAGVALLALIYQSPLDRLGEHHFSLHMVQHSIAMMIVPPLLLLGAPTTPVLRGMPRGFRHGVVAPVITHHVTQRVWNVLTYPIVAILIFTMTAWAWHLMPGWYDAALNNDVLHDLQHVSFVAVSMLFWWNIIDPKPRRSRIPMGFRILYFYAAMVPKHVLAALITFSESVFYPTYEEVRQFLPGSPLQDQQVAGVLMWVPFGELINLATAAIIFVVWWRQTDQSTRSTEAHRDPEPMAATGG